MEIVTDLCPWKVDTVYADGSALDGHGFGCDGAASGWAQYFDGTDIVVELCGETCAAYLAGEVREVEALPFCEAA